MIGRLQKGDKLKTDKGSTMVGVGTGVYYLQGVQEEPSEAESLRFND